MNFLTGIKLAELVEKKPSTIRKYAPNIPGAEKHGGAWFFADQAAAVKWFSDRRKPGKPKK